MKIKRSLIKKLIQESLIQESSNTLLIKELKWILEDASYEQLLNARFVEKDKYFPKQLIEQSLLDSGDEWIYELNLNTSGNKGKI